MSKQPNVPSIVPLGLIGIVAVVATIGRLNATPEGGSSPRETEPSPQAPTWSIPESGLGFMGAIEAPRTGSHGGCPAPSCEGELAQKGETGNVGGRSYICEEEPNGTFLWELNTEGINKPCRR